MYQYHPSVLSALKLRYLRSRAAVLQREFPHWNIIANDCGSISVWTMGKPQDYCLASGSYEECREAILKEEGK